MFYLVKKIEISAAHRLSLNYESKCSNTHGHNWDITVHLKSQTLDENGMIMDFSKRNLDASHFCMANSCYLIS